MSLIIRRASVKDLKAITDIYNEAILTTDATFDTEPKTIAEQKVWFSDHGKKNPILVAVMDGTIYGWASLSKWSTRCAYTDTAEISVYVKQEHRSRGIGKRLMKEIIDKGEKVGLHTVISRITGGNTVSIHLHEKLGFQHIGVMKEVGKKFDRTLDVCMMQKIYHPGQ
ncbi:MAG: N-acetyltransferase family protein [Dehalococcoidales bacterium]|nr:N-acetyltransferase family protein [Dehalococcoidales bacterium]